MLLVICTPFVSLYFFNAGTILSAFGNLRNKSRETLSRFVNIWFDEPGSDLIIWEPPDWQDRYMYTYIVIKLIQ